MRYILQIVTIASFAFQPSVNADQCALGSSLVGGNVYCQSVEAIRYSNIGTAGSYKEVIEMKADGTCKRKTKYFKGPISPLNEEVSLHFRGPLKLKQFAAYTPLTRGKKQRRALVPENSNHANKHQQMHHNLMSKAIKRDYQRRQIVTAIVDGQVVSWENNWFGDTKTATETPSGTPKRDMVTATINGQIVSWENDWVGPATLTTSITSAVPAATQQPNAAADIENARPVSPAIAQNNKQAVKVAPAPKPAQPAKDVLEIQETTASKESSAAPATKNALSSSWIDNSPSRISATGNSADYERIGYYHAASQTLENLVFLGNHGGQGSGVFDYNFGASLAYTNQKGTGGAASPQILADSTLPSGAEVIVMLGEDCSDGGCGYTRPGSVAHHGFGGADKVFLMEFSMPKDGTTGFNADMPAIWMLNAQIPRTLQYGNGNCSCWNSGCGEFDIVETLSTGSMFMKSTLHTNTPGGDSDYFLRPTSGTMKLAVIFDSGEAAAHIQVLPPGYEFPAMFTASDIQRLCSETAASKVSHFQIHS